MEDAAVAAVAGVLALLGSGYFAVAVRKVVLHRKKPRQRRAS